MEIEKSIISISQTDLKSYLHVSMLVYGPCDGPTYLDHHITIYFLDAVPYHNSLSFYIFGTMHHVAKRNLAHIFSSFKLFDILTYVLYNFFSYALEISLSIIHILIAHDNFDAPSWKFYNIC